MSNIRKNIKKFVIFLAIALSSFFVASSEDNMLEVSFFDVGQGDSSFIRANGTDILIDGGPDNTLLSRLGETLLYSDRSIDIIIISHFHDDHVTGLGELLNRYQVSNLIYLKDSKTNHALEYILERVNDENINIIALDGEKTINLGDDCYMKLLDPRILGIKEDDNNSIVSRLDCRGESFLFSGDNERVVEKALLQYDWGIEADTFKASHHGSRTSNSEAFLKKVNPKKVIISSGEGNKFNHPSEEVIERLNSLEIEIYRTDMQGSIRLREH